MLGKGRGRGRRSGRVGRGGQRKKTGKMKRGSSKNKGRGGVNEGT